MSLARSVQTPSVAVGPARRRSLKDCCWATGNLLGQPDCRLGAIESSP